MQERTTWSSQWVIYLRGAFFTFMQGSGGLPAKSAGAGPQPGCASGGAHSGYCWGWRNFAALLPTHCAWPAAGQCHVAGIFSGRQRGYCGRQHWRECGEPGEWALQRRAAFRAQRGRDGWGGWWEGQQGCWPGDHARRAGGTLAARCAAAHLTDCWERPIAGVVRIGCSKSWSGWRLLVYVQHIAELIMILVSGLGFVVTSKHRMRNLSIGSTTSTWGLREKFSEPSVLRVAYDVTGWPVPPSRQPWCGTCPAGWASTTINAQHCRLCSPGSFAASRRSPECAPCANGTYAYSWGSTHCNHCIIGTYAPRQVLALAVSFFVHTCSLHM